VLIFNNGFKLMIFSGFLFSEKFKKKFVSYEFENFKVVRIRSSLEFSAFDLQMKKKIALNQRIFCRSSLRPWFELLFRVLNYFKFASGSDFSTDQKAQRG